MFVRIMSKQNRNISYGYTVHSVFCSTISRHFPTPQLKITLCKSTVEVIVYIYNKTYNVHCTGMFNQCLVLRCNCITKQHVSYKIKGRVQGQYTTPFPAFGQYFDEPYD